MSNNIWKNKAIRKQCDDAWSETTNKEKRQLEHLWLQSAEHAYYYARGIIKKRWPPVWPPGEAAIATSACYSYRYAYSVIQGPWPPGEAVIATINSYNYLYKRHVI